jgi:hypothetical protein
LASYDKRQLIWAERPKSDQNAHRTDRRQNGGEHCSVSKCGYAAFEAAHQECLNVKSRVDFCWAGSAIDRQHRKDSMSVARKIRRFAPLRFDVIHPIAEFDLSTKLMLSPGYYPTNPTFVDTDRGRLVCIRGVNYRVDDNLTPTFFTGDNYHSINRFALLDRRGEVIRALRDLDVAFEGAVDVRLFSFDGALWGSCSRPMSGAALSLGMSLMKLDSDLRGAKAIPLVSPYGSSREKNWLPIVHKGMLHFVYSLKPLVVLRCETPSGRLDFVDPRYAQYSRSSFTFLLCGSASGVSLDNRQLLIVHRRTVRLPGLRRIYVHRCATLDPSLTKLQFGRYFVIDRAEVQFVVGMNVDDDVVRLSYGRMDRSAHLAEFHRGTFMRTFVPDLRG